MNKLLYIMLLLLTVSGCGQEVSSEQVLANAKQLIDNQQYQEAIIELKNSLKKQPKQAQTRFVLGKAYLLAGDLNGANKELKRALEMGYDRNKVLPYYIRSELLTGRFINLTDYGVDARVMEPELVAQLNAISGIYLSVQSKHLQGRDYLHASLQSEQVTTFYTDLAKALLAGFDQQSEEALKLAETLIQNDNEFHDALLLSGVLNILAKQNDTAIAKYQAYLEYRPFNFMAQIHYVSLLIEENQLEKAATAVDRLVKVYPNSSTMNEYKAQLEYFASNYKQAVEYANISLTIDPKLFKANLIAGLGQYHLKNSEMAYHHLSAIEDLLTRDQFAYRVLSAVKFELGYIDQAVDSLAEIDNLNESDFNLISGASIYLLRSGDQKKAQEYVDQLDELDISKPEDLSRRGLIKLSLNDPQGTEDLKQAIKVSPNLLQARLGLLYHHFNKNELEEAKLLAEDWINSDPKSSRGDLALGLVYRQLNQSENARESFESALVKEPESLGALFNLAQLNIVEKNMEEGVNRLVQILDINPSHYGALTHLLGVYKAGEAKQRIQTYFDSLFKNNPEDLNVLITFALFTEMNGNGAKAVALLEKKKPEFSSSPVFVNTLSEISFRDKQLLKSESYARDLLQLTPNNLKAHTRLFVIFEAQKKYSEALNQVKESIKIFPDAADLKLFEISYLLMTDKTKEGVSKLDNIDPNEVTRTLYLSVKLLVEKNSKNYLNARPLAKELFELNPSSFNAFQYGFILQQLSESDQAINVVLAALVKDPESVSLNNMLGELKVESEPAKSVEIYTHLLKKEPNNYVYLNNLAWAAIKIKDYQLGLTSAEKANEIAPNTPQIIDTLAVANLKLGETEKAEKLLEIASRLEPNDNDISLHYAESLIRLNKIAQSEKVLNKIKDSEEKQKLIKLINQNRGL